MILRKGRYDLTAMGIEQMRFFAEGLGRR